MQQMALTLLIKWVLGSDVFSRIETLVHKWAKKQIAGREKRGGVLADAEIIGIKASEWIIRAAIELAVGKMQGFK